ncbi:GLPGLI family protein [Chryseobacterium luquanense]|uniref:GLPGLI family protein n=1 Tax=Chryseobacterium luquanense TaxID=2983766 RepID=A0ABT3Y2I5_9FLAO|nr:GLPGLI family protein [Chryseobacterium luquanense]MCX8532357.1 GLPGLI family protein [Chryseobacterium luquanense]
MNKKIILIFIFFISFMCFSQLTVQNCIEYKLLWLGENYKSFSFSSDNNNLSLLTDNIDFKEGDLNYLADKQHPKFLVNYNRNEDTFYQENAFVGKNDKLKYKLAIDKIKPINWAITKEVKNILGYNCHKATAEIRGRKWEVWFTSEIPNPIFPWKLKDTPGAILEAYDSEKNFYFNATKISLNKNYVLPKKLESYFINENNSETVSYLDAFDADTEQLKEWQSQQIANMNQSIPHGQIPSPRSASFELSIE